MTQSDKKAFKRITFVRLIVGLICSFFLLQCDLEESTDDPGDKINIGVLVPLSGDSRELGDAVRKACELAALEINRGGGVLGKRIKLRIADTEGRPESGVASARAMLTQNVLAYIGPLFSGITIEVAQQVAIPNTIPLISPVSTSPLITNLEENTGTDLIFRTVASDAITGGFAGRYVHDTLGKKTVSMIYVDDAYGAGLSAAFAQSFEDAGGTVLNRISYPFNNIEDILNFDFGPKVDSLFMGEPEVIYMVARSAAGAIISIVAESYISALYHPLFIGADALNTTEFLQNASPVVTDSMYNFVAATDQASTNYQTYLQAYTSKYALNPSSFSENAYDALYLIAYAMIEAQSEDPQQIAALLRKVALEGEEINVNEFIHGKTLIEAGTDIDYNGASGPLKLDANGDISSTVINIMIGHSGTFQVIDKIPFG